jgi:uncharacterized protein YjiS (DUF1127 family)
MSGLASLRSSNGALRDRTAPSDRVRKLADWLIAAAKTYERERRIVRDAKLLSSVDDWTLKDIGISRAEIQFALRRGRESVGRPCAHWRDMACSAARLPVFSAIDRR